LEAEILLRARGIRVTPREERRPLVFWAGLGFVISLAVLLIFLFLFGR